MRLRRFWKPECISAVTERAIARATGSAGKPVGDALSSVGTGVQNGADSVSKGVENAGQWKK